MQMLDGLADQIESNVIIWVTNFFPGHGEFRNNKNIKNVRGCQ